MSSQIPSAAAPPDAVVILSFGGPRGPEDVVPFLQNVTRGRQIPESRLQEVGKHYFDRGGVSPINEHNDQIVDTLTTHLRERGSQADVFVANRNWSPYLPQVLDHVAEQGHRNVRIITTSAYSSYSGCRQYRENIAAAAARAELATQLKISKAAPYWDHPGFHRAQCDVVAAALAQSSEPAQLLFVTHSIPVSMNDASGPNGGRYAASHHELADAVVRTVRSDADTNLADRIVGYDVVYCSRSGPPQMPWLEPDINDRIAELHGHVGRVVVVPFGFISDHMEVVYDLDTEAAQTAADHDLNFVRADTVDTHPAFQEMLVELATSTDGWECATHCCANARAPQTPAACQRPDGPGLGKPGPLLVSPPPTESARTHSPDRS